MNCEQTYEIFVRKAFGYSMGNKAFSMVGRKGDLAGIADADKYRNNDLVSIKAATSYAMCIFANALYRGPLLSDSNLLKEKKRIDKIIKSVLDAGLREQICEIIEHFDSSVVYKYFESGEHGVTLRTKSQSTKLRDLIE